MFFLLAIFFILFTLGYAAFAWAVMYHFKEYTPPHSHTTEIVAIAFAALSGIAWVYALISLLSIRLLI